MKTYTLTFNGSGTDTQQIGAYGSGKHFRVLTASAALDVTTLDRGSHVIDTALGLLGGDGFASTGVFDLVQLNSASAQTVQVAVSDSPIESNRAAGGSVAISSPSTLGTAADVAIVGAAAAVQVLAASATRRTAILGSLSTNTGSIRLGDSNVGAARGYELTPGSSVFLDTQSAVYAYAAANQTLTVTFI